MSQGWSFLWRSVNWVLICAGFDVLCSIKPKGKSFSKCTLPLKSYLPQSFQTVLLRPQVRLWPRMLRSPHQCLEPLYPQLYGCPAHCLQAHCKDLKFKRHLILIFKYIYLLDQWYVTSHMQNRTLVYSHKLFFHFTLLKYCKDWQSKNYLVLHLSIIKRHLYITLVLLTYVYPCLIELNFEGKKYWYLQITVSIGPSMDWVPCISLQSIPSISVFYKKPINPIKCNILFHFQMQSLFVQLYKIMWIIRHVYYMPFWALMTNERGNVPTHWHAVKYLPSSNI